MGFVGGFVETQQVGSPDGCNPALSPSGPLNRALFHVKQYSVQRRACERPREVAYV